MSLFNSLSQKISPKTNPAEPKKSKLHAKLPHPLFFLGTQTRYQKILPGRFFPVKKNRFPKKFFFYDLTPGREKVFKISKTRTFEFFKNSKTRG